jgi:predicted transposase YdaD
MAKRQTPKVRMSLKKGNQKPPKKEGNAFDKIFKEVIERVFRPLVEKKLGIKIVKSTPLKEKMQTTIELEMDFFYEIVPEIGEKFILHLEFESGNNLEMIYRIVEYHGLSFRRYKLPVRHLVVYLGAQKPTMRTELKPEEILKGFDLLDVHALDTNELLSSQIPEVVLIAILSNFELEQAETILRSIIAKLKGLIKNKRVLKKYINQLMMLSRLRKIEDLTIKIAEEMPIHFDYETDTLYLRGEEKGVTKGIVKGIEQGIEQGREEESKKKEHAFVTNLILVTDFSDEKIALLAGVSAEYVQKVRSELAQKK